MSFLRDDATLASYRSLVACDPLWSAEYARQQWFEDDPWLRHAMGDSEPIRSSELVLHSPREEAFIEAAARAGFASVVIAPAPSSHGPSRVGVLALGSATPGFFDGDGYATVRVLARALTGPAPVDEAAVARAAGRVGLSPGSGRVLVPLAVERRATAAR